MKVVVHFWAVVGPLLDHPRSPAKHCCGRRTVSRTSKKGIDPLLFLLRNAEALSRDTQHVRQYRVSLIIALLSSSLTLLQIKSAFAEIKANYCLLSYSLKK